MRHSGAFLALFIVLLADLLTSDVSQLFCNAHSLSSKDFVEIVDDLQPIAEVIQPDTSGGPGTSTVEVVLAVLVGLFLAALVVINVLMLGILILSMRACTPVRTAILGVFGTGKGRKQTRPATPGLFVSCAATSCITCVPPTPTYLEEVPTTFTDPDPGPETEWCAHPVYRQHPQIKAIKRGSGRVRRARQR